MQANSGTFRTHGPLSIDGAGTLSTNWAGSLSLGGNISGNSTAFASSNPLGVVTLNGRQLVGESAIDRGDEPGPGQHGRRVQDTTLSTARINVHRQTPSSSINRPTRPEGPNALYVNSLLVTASDTLDLNGLHVYARAVQINGGPSSSTAPSAQFPDGGPIDINSPLPGAISPAGNKTLGRFSAARVKWSPPMSILARERRRFRFCRT